MPRTIEPFYAELGQRIGDARKRSRLTQEALGGKLDGSLTRAAIANIESGKQRVLTKTLVDIAFALDVPAESLLPPRRPAAGPEPGVSLEAELVEGVGLPTAMARRLARQLKPRGGT